MKHPLIAAALVAIGLVGVSPSNAADPTMPTQSAQGDVALSKKVDAALFRIHAGNSQGSGFLYRNDGYVLTNKHVVDSVRVGATVTLHPVTTRSDGIVLAGDAISGVVKYMHPTLDVAVIEIKMPKGAGKLKPIVVAGGQHVPRGTAIFAHGFPYLGTHGSAPVMARGALSAHELDPVTGEVWYKSDLATGSGGSGGPVTDAAGFVVGIASAVSRQDTEGANTQGWAYIIPIKLVDESLATAGGFKTLPKVFSPLAHVSAIAGATKVSVAAEAHKNGVLAAVKETGTAMELAAALDALDSGLEKWNKTVTVDDARGGVAPLVKEWTPLFTRAFELELGSDADAGLGALWERIFASRCTARLAELHRGAVTRLSPQQQQSSTAQWLKVYSDALSLALVSAEQSCGKFPAFAKRWESAKADVLEQRTLQREACQLRASLAVGALVAKQAASLADEMDPSDPALPVSAAQSLRTARAVCRKCVERWNSISDECREVGERQFDGANGAEGVRGGSDGNDAPVTLSDYANFLIACGCEPWGEIQQERLSGDSTAFSLNFNKAPAVMRVLLSVPGGGRGLTGEPQLKVIEPGGKSGWVGGPYKEGSEGTTIWEWHAEASADGLYGFELAVPGGAGKPVEYFVLHHDDELASVKQQLKDAAQSSDMEWLEARLTCLVTPGATEVMSVEAPKRQRYLAVATSIRGEDIDMVVLGPDFREVGSDTKPDSTPGVFLSDAGSGRYTIRVTNADKKPAIVQVIWFGGPRP